MSDSERIIGFDIREMWLDPEGFWPAARREMFLLRTTVAKPLAADPLVWPPALWADRVAAGLFPIEHLADLYGSIDEARRALLGPPARTQPASEVAVTRLIGVGAFRGLSGWPTSQPLEELRPPKRSRLLGYDVADDSLTSGLSNCGYLPDERAALRGTWSDRLNHHHLFPEPQDALEFCAVTDNRVPEHAPFFVYGLYLLSCGE